MKNLFADIPHDLPEELFETLLENEHVQVERIVSRGHVLPEGDWYDQARNEFVLLLSGAARLEFEDGSKLEMRPGDYLQIPAQCKHRVIWTQEAVETVWLALHYSS